MSCRACSSTCCMLYMPAGQKHASGALACHQTSAGVQSAWCLALCFPECGQRCQPEHLRPQTGVWRHLCICSMLTGMLDQLQAWHGVGAKCRTMQCCMSLPVRQPYMWIPAMAACLACQQQARPRPKPQNLLFTNNGITINRQDWQKCSTSTHCAAEPGGPNSCVLCSPKSPQDKKLTWPASSRGSLPAGIPEACGDACLSSWGGWGDPVSPAWGHGSSARG